MITVIVILVVYLIVTMGQTLFLSALHVNNLLKPGLLFPLSTAENTISTGGLPN